jgi:nitroreductase
MKTYLKVDESKCKKCSICTNTCPSRINISKRISSGLENKGCCSCLHCYAACPHEAISIKGMGILYPDKKSSSDIDDNQLFDFLARRRSYRKFKDLSIERPVIDKLVSAALLIPSGGNSHPYDFTVIIKNDTREMLAAMIKTDYLAKDKLLRNIASRKVLSLFADSQTKAFINDREYLGRVLDIFDQLKNGRDPVFYQAPAVIFIHSSEVMPTPKEDCVLAAYNMVLMAESLGLGTCIVTLAQNAINDSKRCKKILGLKKQDVVHAVVVLGYPEEQYLRPVPKKEKEMHLV